MSRRTTRTTQTLILAAIVFMVVGNRTDARILHIPEQYPTIQAGIDAAETGDTLLVAKGIYSGPGNHDIVIGSKGLLILSENGPEATFIDGSEDPIIPIGQWVHHTARSHIEFNDDKNAPSTLEGFTIQDMNSSGIQFRNSSSTVRRCIIMGNIGRSGGGVSCSGDASPTLINCLIVNNTAISGYGDAWFNLASDGLGAGIMSLGDSVPRLYHCTISNNTSIVYTPEGSTLFESSPFKGAGIYFGVQDILFNDVLEYKSGVQLVNTIVWNNTTIRGFESQIEEISPDINALVSITHSLIGGGFPGDQNIDHDPMFSDPIWNTTAAPADTYSLDSNSPCIDTGVPLTDVKTDLLGNPRITGGLPDMGALEYTGDPANGHFNCTINASQINYETLDVWFQCSGNGAADEIDSFYIDFGDGSRMVTQPNGYIQHTYPSAGVYIVTCSMTDASGQMTTPCSSPLTVLLRQGLIIVPDDFSTLQEAVDAAENDAIILLRDGTFTSSNATVMTVFKKHLIVMSENGPEKTILDCSSNDDGIVVYDATLDLRGISVLNSRRNGILIKTGTALIRSCIFTGNQNGITGSSLDAANSIFSKNKIGINAAAPNFHTTITNCTLIDNTSCGIDSGDRSDDSELIISNCIIRGNEEIQIAYRYTDPPLISFCNVEGGWRGKGIIDADPLFTDPENGNYRLLGSSPCIDAGEEHSAPSEDFEGDVRPSGSGVDIGADEFVETTTEDSHPDEPDNEPDTPRIPERRLMTLQIRTTAISMEMMAEGQAALFLYCSSAKPGNASFIEETPGVYSSVRPNLHGRT